MIEGYTTQKTTLLLKKNEAVQIFSAWQECFLYFLKKSKNKNDKEEQSFLIEKIYFNTICSMLVLDDFVCPPSAAFGLLTNPLAKIVLDNSFDSILSQFFNLFSSFIVKQFSSSSSSNSPSFVSNVCSFFASLSKNLSGKFSENSPLSSFIEGIKKFSVKNLESNSKKIFKIILIKIK